MPGGTRSLRAAAATLVASLAAAASCSPAASARPGARPSPARPAADQLAPFRGVGGWLDIYDSPTLWDNAQATVASLAADGVSTLYVETANYRQPPSRLIVRAPQLAALIDAAHAGGLSVVGWYLPGLVNTGLDLERARAALSLTTPAGGRLDGFALDIESSLLASISMRNAAVAGLSRQVRSLAGDGYPLGAIVPDDRSTMLGGLWPEFPYSSLAPSFDAFLPMAYSTHRTRGAAGVYAYTLRNIRRVRQLTGEPHLPIHVIGGLANGLSPAEVRAVLTAARRARAVGASFYNFAASRPDEWAALHQFATPAVR